MESTDLILSDQDRIVQDIKVATGWQNVEFVEDSYVISFPIANLRSIKGVRPAKDTFVLDFESFSNLPISFLVNINGSIHQYWTLNGKQHRGNSRPAYVAIDAKEDRVIRRWHWHGLLHRVDGPAKEIMKGFDVSMDLPDMGKHYRESYDYLHCEWWQEGLQAVYPSPKACTIQNGWALKRKKTRRLDSPRPDLAAFGADNIEIEWDALNNRDMDSLLPLSAELINTMELYDDGTYKSREADYLEVIWHRGGKQVEAPKLNSEIHAKMLSDLGLWKAPFYTTDDMEFIVLSEYDRLENQA